MNADQLLAYLHEHDTTENLAVDLAEVLARRRRRALVSVSSRLSQAANVSGPRRLAS